MNLLRPFISLIFIVVLLFNSSTSVVKAEVMFQNGFEYGVFPSWWTHWEDEGASIELSTEKSLKGVKSLKLVTNSTGGGCGVNIPVQIDFEQEMEFRVIHYFEYSEPIYRVGIVGLVGDDTSESFFLEYGNPIQDWVLEYHEEPIFRVSNFDVPEQEWNVFNSNLSSDIEVALNHSNNPFKVFTPTWVRNVVLALNPAVNNESRIIFVDSIEITTGLDEISTGEQSSEELNNIEISSIQSMPTQHVNQSDEKTILLIPSLTNFHMRIFGIGGVLLVTSVIVLFFAKKY